MEEHPVILTDAEVHDKAKLVARKVGELRAHQDESKRLMAGRKADEKDITKEIDTLSGEVRSRRETRPVEVYEHANHALLRIETVRLDTNETVRYRPMDEHEREKSRQGDLFDYADKKFEDHAEKKRVADNEKALEAWSGKGKKPKGDAANPVLKPEDRERIEAEAAQRAAAPEDAEPPPPKH
jgi:hypothetical protein